MESRQKKYKVERPGSDRDLLAFRAKATLDEALLPVASQLPLTRHDRATLMAASRDFRRRLAGSQREATRHADLCSEATKDGELCSRSWRFRPTDAPNSVGIDCSRYCTETRCAETLLRLARGVEAARDDGVAIVLEMEGGKAHTTVVDAPHVRLYVSLDPSPPPSRERKRVTFSSVRNDRPLVAGFEQKDDTPIKRYLLSLGWERRSATEYWGPAQVDQVAPVACAVQAMLRREHPRATIEGRAWIHVEGIAMQLPSRALAVKVQPLRYDVWPAHSWGMKQDGRAAKATVNLRWLWPPA